jgi:outer membrane protein TolC
MSTQDVIEARARAERRRESLFLGRRSVVAAENDLGRLIYERRHAGGTPARIEPRIEVPEAPPVAQLDAWSAAALDLRPDYQQVRLVVEQRRIEAGYERNQQKPAVDLVASYGYNGSGDTFSDSWDRIRTGDDESYSVGAVVSVPVFNRAGSARRRAAEIELRRAELALADFEEEVRRQLDDAIAGIESARERVMSTHGARLYAEQSLEAEEKRLRAGTSSTFLVLEQQEIVAESQLRALQAAADLAMALADFQRLSGRTIEAAGLDPSAVGIVPDR